MAQSNAQTDNIKDKGDKPQKRPPKKITEKYLYNAGLSYLQRFAASTSHFHKIMMRKIDRSCKHHTDQNKDECIRKLEAVIAKFQDLGLLNDAGYTKGMVTSYRKRGLSAKAIYAKLIQKGITGDKIQHEIEKFDSENSDNDGEFNDGEFIAALIYARKKRLGPFDTKNADYDKQLAKLARSGFSFDIAQKILSISHEEAHEYIEKTF